MSFRATNRVNLNIVLSWNLQIVFCNGAWIIQARTRESYVISGTFVFYGSVIYGIDPFEVISFVGVIKYQGEM